MSLGNNQKSQGARSGYRNGEELSWCPSWSNSRWQGWSCGLVHCPGGNATDPIWRVLASSDGISSWIPLKPQQRDHQKFVGGFALSGVLGSGRASMLPLWTLFLGLSVYSSHTNIELCTYCLYRFMQDAPKAVWIIPYVSLAFFPSLKHNFIAYRSSKVSDCNFEIHQLWLSGFSRVYSNCYYNCSFKLEIIKIGQSSHKVYSNNLLNFQESMTILNAHTKKVCKLIVCPL